MMLVTSLHSLLNLTLPITSVDEQAASLSTATERSQNGIEHPVKLRAHVLDKKAQDEVAVLLQQLVLAPVAAIGVRIRKMLSAVQLYRQARIGTEQIHLEHADRVECDR